MVPSHLKQARSAISAVEQVEELVHDRTSLFDQVLATLRGDHFRPLSRAAENGFVGAENGFFGTMLSGGENADSDRQRCGNVRRACEFVRSKYLRTRTDSCSRACGYAADISGKPVALYLAVLPVLAGGFGAAGVFAAVVAAFLGASRLRALPQGSAGGLSGMLPSEFL
jgi:hypothetical protein